MMSKKSKTPGAIDYRAEQDKMERLLGKVQAELQTCRGVVEVGMGLREQAGEITPELVWRIHVVQKKPLAELDEADRIPAVLHGYPTDVMTTPVFEVDLGFDDEDDTKNYSRKIGGITINRDGHNFGGTLGCFVKTSDNKVAILTNYHILWEPGETPTNGKGVGQPEHSSSLCCTCNEIATTVAPPAGAGRHSDGKLDCAMAVLKSGVKYSPKIKQIVRGDGTVELEGTIAGSEAPTVNDVVWKVGRSNGLTRGRISGIVGNLVSVTPNPPFTAWSASGDSGAAVVKQANGKIVALHWGRPESTPTTGVAIPITAALALLNVTVIPTSSGDGTQRGSDDERLGLVASPRPEDTFAAIADRLQMTPRGGEVLAHYRRHSHEISRLVNTSRPVTLAWQRNAGPAWMAAVMRSAREPLYRLPEALNDVPRGQLGERLVAALDRHGTPELRAALAEHAAEVRRVWLEHDTVDAMIADLGADDALAEAAE